MLEECGCIPEFVFLSPLLLCHSCCSAATNKRDWVSSRYSKSHLYQVRRPRRIVFHIHLHISILRSPQVPYLVAGQNQKKRETPRKLPHQDHSTPSFRANNFIPNPVTMANLVGTIVGIVIGVLAFTAIVLVFSLYWQRIFGRIPTEDRHRSSGSFTDAEKGWPKMRDDSFTESGYSVPRPSTSPRSSKTSDDPAMQKAVLKN